MEPDVVMNFYGNKGLIVANCPILKTHNVKPVALVHKAGKELDMPVMSDKKFSDLVDFALFVTDGVVSLPGSSVMVPIKTLWDTAASQSFILERVLPFSNEFAIVSNVTVNDFGMKYIGVPLHKVSVE